MNERFLEEAKQLENKWAKLGIIDKLSRATTAKMMECQRLFNETGTWDCCDECKEREKKNES